MLQVSTVHVYLTYPFVLSWSLLEAMACGCFVIGADTAPVREFIRDGANGQLVDFLDQEAITRGVSHVLRNYAQYRQLRRAAREDGRHRVARSRGLSELDRLCIEEGEGRGPNVGEATGRSESAQLVQIEVRA